MNNINFLPWRKERIMYKNRIFAAYAAVVLTIALLPIILISSVIGLRLQQKNTDVAYLNTELSKLEPKIAEIKSLEKLKDIFLEKSSVLENLQRYRNMVIYMLNDISESIPDELFLTKMARQENKLLLSGQAMSSQFVSVFMGTISKYFWVKNVSLNELQAITSAGGAVNAQEQGITFSLTILIDSERKYGT